MHDKLDHLLHKRWEDLIEIQERQVELLELLRAGGDANAAGTSDGSAGR